MNAGRLPNGRIIWVLSDDPFTELVRNEIPGENSPSIQATVASYGGIDRQESAAAAMGNATPFGSSRAA